MSISEQGILVFVPLYLATALHIPSLCFQYHNTIVLTSGQIVLLQVFDPHHIRPLGFQYHDIRDLALVQIVVLRLSPPSINEETCILLYKFFVHTFVKLLVQVSPLKVTLLTLTLFWSKLRSPFSNKKEMSFKNLQRQCI